MQSSPAAPMGSSRRRRSRTWIEELSIGRPMAIGSAGGSSRRRHHVPSTPARAGPPAARPRSPAVGRLPPSARNAWVVPPPRPASGARLLASAPHLGVQAPILWYLARIDLADGRLLAGATSPGVPMIVIGRND